MLALLRATYDVYGSRIDCLCSLKSISALDMARLESVNCLMQSRPGLDHQPSAQVRSEAAVDSDKLPARVSFQALLHPPSLLAGALTPLHHSPAQIWLHRQD